MQVIKQGLRSFAADAHNGASKDFTLYIRKFFQIYKFASLPPNISGNLSEFVLTVHILYVLCLYVGHWAMGLNYG